MNISNDSRFNRRRFLQRASLAGGALVLPQIVPRSVLGAAATKPPSERINLGFIGTGGRGRDLLKGFLAMPDARVVSFCDPFEDRRRKAAQMADDFNHSGYTLHHDFRELIARKQVDAVIIATQDHWHAPIAVAAAKAGKAIYCEKPLGVSYRESRIMRQVVRQSGVVFQTGTQQRSDGKFRQACELARNGYLGKIHTVEVAAEGPNYKPSYQGSLDPQPVPAGLEWETYLGPAPARPYNPGLHGWPDWYLIWDYCYGFIVNWGVHHLDIALWGCPALAAEPFTVEGRTSYRHEGFTDNVYDWHVTFQYASGLKMIYSDHYQQKLGCRFIGSEGWVYVDRSGIWAEPASLLELKLKGSDTPLQRSEHHGMDFLKSVRSGKDPVSPVEAGHQATYFGMVADIAGRLKRPLKWDPRTEEFINDAGAGRLLDRPMRAPWTV